MRQVTTYQPDPASLVQQPEYGGTGTDDLAKAAAALGLVSKNATSAGEVLIPLASNGRIKPEYIDSKEVRLYSLSGNPIVPKGTTVQFVITGPNPASMTLTASDAGAAGSVTRTDNVISFTAPNAPKKVTLTLDSLYTWELDIRGALPVKPTIVSPVQGAVGQAATITVTGSAYAAGSAGAFKESVWQIADNLDFTDARQVVFTGAVTGSIDQLAANRNYYLRVKYNDTTNQGSDWSDVTGFSTKAAFLPSTEVAQILPTAAILENSGTTSFSAVRGFRVGAAGGGNEGRIVITTDKADIINAAGFHEFDGAAYVFGKNPSLNWLAQTKGTSSIKKFQSEPVVDAGFAAHVAMSGNGRWMSVSAQKALVGRSFLLQYLDTLSIADQVLTPDKMYTDGFYFGPHVLSNDAARLTMLTGDSLRLVVWKSALGGREVAQTIVLNNSHGVGRKKLIMSGNRELLFVISKNGIEVFKVMDGQSAYLTSVKYQAHGSTTVDVGDASATYTGDVLAVCLTTNTDRRVDIVEYSVSTNTLTSKSVQMPVGEVRFGESVALAADAAVLYVGSPATVTGGKVYRYSGVRVGQTLVTDMTIQHSNAGAAPTGEDESEYGRSIKFSRRYTELIVASSTRIHVLR